MSTIEPIIIPEHVPVIKQVNVIKHVDVIITDTITPIVIYDSEDEIEEPRK